MDLMQSLQNMLGQDPSGRSGNQADGLGSVLGNILGGGIQIGQAKQQSQAGLSGLGGLGNLAGGMLGNLGGGGLLGPAVLGGLLGALTGRKATRVVTGGALLAGGAALWNMYKQRMQEESGKTGDGRYLSQTSAKGFAALEQPAPVQERAERLVRAMIFAAKSDGNIDAEEQRNITARIKELNIGPDAQTLVNKCLAEPLNPELIAKGVTSAEEALELFTLSCAIINVDHFMERSYLDALARALRIPDDIKNDIETKIKAPA